MGNQTSNCGGGAYTAHANMDAPGHDIRNAGTQDICALVRQCDADPACRGFNVSGWLKRDVGAKVGQPGTTLYTKDATPPVPTLPVVPTVPATYNVGGVWTITGYSKGDGALENQIVGQRVVVTDDGSTIQVTPEIQLTRSNTPLTLEAAPWIRLTEQNVPMPVKQRTNSGVSASTDFSRSQNAFVSNGFRAQYNIASFSSEGADADIFFLNRGYSNLSNLYLDKYADVTPVTLGALAFRQPSTNTILLGLLVGAAIVAGVIFYRRQRRQARQE